MLICPIFTAGQLICYRMLSAHVPKAWPAANCTPALTAGQLIHVYMHTPTTRILTNHNDDARSMIHCGMLLVVLVAPLLSMPAALATSVMCVCSRLSCTAAMMTARVPCRIVSFLSLACGVACCGVVSGMLTMTCTGGCCLRLTGHAIVQSPGSNS